MGDVNYSYPVAHDSVAWGFQAFTLGCDCPSHRYGLSCNMVRPGMCLPLLLSLLYAIRYVLTQHTSPCQSPHRKHSSISCTLNLAQCTPSGTVHSICHSPLHLSPGAGMCSLCCVCRDVPPHQQQQDSGTRAVSIGAATVVQQVTSTEAVAAAC